VTIDGYVHPGFTPVATAFRHQIGRTTGGAAVAVYHRGKLVVDLWGGRRDDTGAAWERDSLAMCFSTTKGLTSTALHLLAQRKDRAPAQLSGQFAASSSACASSRLLVIDASSCSICVSLS